MKIRKFLYAVLAAGMFAAAISGQTPDAKVAPKFTSVYSNLNKDCRTIHGRNGTDDASVCRGVGGYQIRMYSAAAAFYISAEIKGKDGSFNLATTDNDFDTRKTRIEWRIANGKPFAAIIRVPKYADATSENPYFGKVIGEELVVAGLDGYDIDLSVDAKEPNANIKARELADKAYLDSRKN